MTATSTNGHDLTEQFLIGAMLAGIVPDGIDTIDFADAKHRRIARAVFDCKDRGEIGPAKVADELERCKELYDVRELYALMEATPVAAEYFGNDWARKVRADGEHRRLTEFLRSIAARAADKAISRGDLIAEMQSFIDSTAGTSLAADTSIDSAALDSANLDCRFLVSDVLVAGQPCVAAAPKKSLKTNIVGCDLNLSLASGSKFLGYFTVPVAVPSALISGESGAWTIQETARRIARSKPWVNLADYTNARWCFDLPQLGTASALSRLRQFIRRHRLKALIIDPAYLAFAIGDDAGNFFKVGEFILPLLKLCADEGVTLIIVHHLVKSVSVTDSPPELESIAWAGFQEFARQWILLSRRAKYQPDQPGHHELWFTAGGSAGHSVAKAIDIEEGDRRDSGGRRWEVTVRAIGEAVADAVEAQEVRKEQRQTIRAERQRAKDIEAVRAALQANPAGLTFTKLRERSGVQYARLQALTAELCQAGGVIACKVSGANGIDYDGFQLPPVQPVQPVQNSIYTNSTTTHAPVQCSPPSS